MTSTDPNPASLESPGGLVRWLGGRAWWFKLLGVIALAGGAGAVPTTRWVEHHFTDDPAFCTSCHAGEAAHLPVQAHPDTPCTGCHESRFTQNVRQWWLAKTGRPDATTPHGSADRTRCRTCHQQETEKVRPLAHSFGHRAHVEGAPRLACSECHGSEAHAYPPDPKACERCHEDRQVHHAGMQNVACVSCHNYLASTAEAGRVASWDCRRCHGNIRARDRSDRFAQTVQPGAVKVMGGDRIHGNLDACHLCHNPHAKDPREQFSGSDCIRCHAKVTEERHHQLNPDQFDCTSCHTVHGERSALEGSCNRCHQQGTAPGGEKHLASKHTTCADCHVPHEFVASSDRCGKCHQPQVDKLLSWDAKEHEHCTNCHAGHASDVEQKACRKCHQKGTGPGHASCTTCHDPHADASSTQTCAACHQGQVRALRTSSASHGGGCAICHNPHAAGAASGKCAACHDEEAGLVASAGVPKHSRCASCHKAHAFGASGDTCNGCHQMASLGPHAGECKQCHEAHGPPTGGKTCRSCHGAIPAATRGRHADCKSCHQAHDPGSKAPDCKSCHGGHASGAAAWSAAQHRNCDSCHQPHDVARPAPCSQCHGAEVAQTARSRHRCSQCHNAHQAPSNWWGRCQQCHGGQAAAVRGRGATHSKCEKCHQPHGFASPTCRSCHAGLQGAHSFRGHNQCRKCHDAHARRTPSRADCLGCHREQRDHFPNASNCAGCHPFR